MRAFLRFRNGDVRELTLLATQIRQGQPVPTITWIDGDDGLGGEKVGERTFWLDVQAMRYGTIRYVEMPR